MFPKILDFILRFWSGRRILFNYHYDIIIDKQLIKLKIEIITDINL